VHAIYLYLKCFVRAPRIIDIFLSTLMNRYVDCTDIINLYIIIVVIVFVVVVIVFAYYSLCVVCPLLFV
jgi:hypothetical protein